MTRIADAFSLVSVIVANLVLWSTVFSLLLPPAGAR